MDAEHIKRYWTERAAGDASAQSTTQDVYLREIEYRGLRDKIEEYSPKTVVDLGCGDGRTTARLARDFNTIGFTGIDYAASMIENATRLAAEKGISNLTLVNADVMHPLPIIKADLIFTTRCLINIPSWKSQKIAIKNIHAALSSRGIFIMVENFTEGQNNFNRLRKEYSLPEIPVRDHNLFFNDKLFKKFITSYFNIIENVNISSTYYIVTRIIYSSLCQEKGEPPDYFDKHHELASRLPFAGNFGPVRMLCLQKKDIS